MLATCTDRQDATTDVIPDDVQHHLIKQKRPDVGDYDVNRRCFEWYKFPAIHSNDVLLGSNRGGLFFGERTSATQRSTTIDIDDINYR